MTHLLIYSASKLQSLYGIFNFFFPRLTIISLGSHTPIILNTLGGLHVPCSALPLLHKDPSTTPVYICIPLECYSSLLNFGDSSQRSTCFGERDGRRCVGDNCSITSNGLHQFRSSSEGIRGHACRWKGTVPGLHSGMARMGSWGQAHQRYVIKEL
jgi:hypothetical protein